MHGKDLFVDDGRNWQAVEAICEGLPELDVVAALALIVEAVDAVDRGTLVISTKNEEILWVFDLVRQKQADRLQGLLASIHVIAEEKVVGLRREATVLKQPQEIVVLAMDIAANLEHRALVR